MSRTLDWRCPHALLSLKTESGGTRIVYLQVFAKEALLWLKKKLWRNNDNSDEVTLLRLIYGHV